jgi:riboflavin kinase / FMN adenylyltransferase
LKIVRLDDLLAEKLSTSLSLGFFDGVHLGHRNILQKTVQDARARGYESAVFTFLNHPLRLIAPNLEPQKITTFSEKQALMRELELDYFIWTDFDRDFSRISCDDFVRKILVNRMGVNNLFIGPNYRFGFNALGDPERLKSLGRELGFAVDVLPPLSIEGNMVSSTLIRQAIAQGNVRAASHLLGRPYEISGVLSAMKTVLHAGARHTPGLVRFPAEKVSPRPGTYRIIYGAGNALSEGIACVQGQGEGPDEEPGLVLYPLDLSIAPTEGKVTVRFADFISDLKEFVSGPEIPIFTKEDRKRVEILYRERRVKDPGERKVAQ